MSNIHKRPPVTERRVRQFRVNPPNPKDGDGNAKFTAKLNQQFSLIADELARIPKFPRGYSIDEYARKDEVEEIVDRLDEQAFDLISSEGDDEVDVGAGRRAAQSRSSRRRHRAQQTAEAAANAALESARPLAAPPEVEDVGAIGTANTPPRFSYEDHTHSGVNLGDAQTITGLKTFDRDPAAPFAVTAGSAFVANLDADLLDGLDATFFAWLTGRAGGQTLRGGTAASESLTFSSTLNATKGSIFFGISSAAGQYDETNNRLGLGGPATVNAKIHTLASASTEETFRFETTETNDNPNYYAFQDRVTTTDATTTTLATITLTASNTYMIEARVIARRTGGAAGTADDGGAWVLRGAYNVLAGAATALDGTTPQTDFESDNQDAWVATLDTSGGDVRVRVTGAVDNDIVWHATVMIQNVGT